MARYVPPVGFHFRVDVVGLSGGDDLRFTEVGGLAVEMGSEEVPEGGENRFVQKYPTRAKYPELVVDLMITPRAIDVVLLNEAHEPLMTWYVVGAWPTKWAVADLNAANNAYSVETLQFAYQHFTVNRN
jgi:hypothetical protein